MGMQATIYALEPDAKKYPCPVCCRHFARDRDMILLQGKRESLYLCESVLWDDLSCLFNFLEGTSKEEIDRLAKNRIYVLRERA